MSRSQTATLRATVTTLVGVLFALAMAQDAAAQDRPAGIIDLHIHIAGIGAGDTGCFLSKNMRDNYRFDIYLWAMRVTLAELEEHGDALAVQRLSEELGKSKRIARGVILALDGVMDAHGKLDRARTEVYVPNEYVAREAAKYDNLLFGASVNPARKDWLKRLEWASKNGAVLVKWIPSIMGINPAAPELIPFYRKLKQLELPLLTHPGMERSFSGARDEPADPLRL